MKLKKLLPRWFLETINKTFELADYAVLFLNLQTKKLYILSHIYFSIEKFYFNIDFINLGIYMIRYD